MDQDYTDFAEEDDTRLLQAHRALNQGDDALALELAEDYLAEFPLNVDALNLCAVAAGNVGDGAKALALYGKALLLDPGNGAMHYNFGMLLHQMDLRQAALWHLQRALELQPDFPEIYLSLGNILDEAGRPAEALPLFAEALRRAAPNVVDVYFSQGCALNRLERFAEALDCFDRVLRLQPRSAPAWNGRGYALSGLGKESQALKSFRQAARLAPEIAGFHFNCALSLSRMGQDDAALRQFDRAWERDRDFWPAVWEKILLLMRLGRLEKAEAALSEVKKNAAKRCEWHYCLGLLRAAGEDWLAALASLDRCLALEPDALFAQKEKGRVLMALGRLDEALRCFDAVLELAEGDPQVDYHRACVLARQGRPRLAIQALSRAADGDPGFLQAAAFDHAFDGVRNLPSFQRLFKMKKAEG
jgi:tetratricopeptide (TPR) repeat protein